MSKAARPAPRILLVGGGHTSIYALKRAAGWVRRGAHVTLLSDHPYLYYSGMVPEYLGGLYRTDEVRLDLVRWCAVTGAQWHEGRAVALDLGARAVTTEAGETLRADLVAFDIGARNPAPPGQQSAVDYTKPLHAIEHFAAWLDAVAESDAGEPKHLVVVGGGAAGTEVALNVSARMLAASGSERLGKRLRLTLVEPAETLLGGFPRRAQRTAERLLRARGARLRLGERVEAIETGTLRFASGDYLDADRILWATGTRASPLFAEAGLATGARGFVRVTPSLHAPGHPWLFAAGDCALVEGHEDLARIGVHAVKQGDIFHGNLDAALGQLLRGDPLDPTAYATFEPFAVAPLILSTGAPKAIYVAGKAALHNRLSLRVKHWADLRWMADYRFGEGAEVSLGEKLHGRSALG